LVRGVLEPIHQGTPVAYQPAKWREHFRAGAIFVPLGCPLVIVEGSGSGRRELMPWLDALVWVQSDLVEAERRCLVRDGASEEAKCFWSEWTAEELPFYAHQRPWERADSFVAGTPTLPHDARTEIVTSACSDVRGDP